MSDINLINDPGVQNDNNEYRDVGLSQLKDDSTYLKKTGIKKYKKTSKNKKNFSFLIFLIVLISLAVYIYNYNNLISSNPNRQQNFLVQDIINILDENQLDINVSLIAFNQNQFSINLKCSNEKSFYKIFDSFANIMQHNVKGYHIQNNYVLNIDLPWNIKNNKNFNIDLLNKEMIDLDLDLRQELYQNKLIIVSDFDKIINFINLIIELSLIHNFLIEIRQVDSLPDNMNLYQVIVE